MTGDKTIRDAVNIFGMVAMFSFLLDSSAGVEEVEEAEEEEEEHKDVEKYEV